MSKEIFTSLKEDPNCRARTGILSLAHGQVKTPVFMPVGTNATVKAVSKDSLEEIGFEIILANTYHLFLRPGHELIRKAGGLHGFTSWRGNFLTDSGGFQIFSLSKLRKITEEGVTFQSHIDGSKHFMSPEFVVDVQMAFASDIFMQLDVCTPWNTKERDAIKALDITTSWLKRSKEEWVNHKEGNGNLFGIVQGNFYKNLREQSVASVVDINTPGIAIGGLSVGEPKEVYHEMLAYTASLLPRSKPVYVMGIGSPDYILSAVENGVDMFDCVLPTRTARNGLLFTWNGPIKIKNAKYKEDFLPIDPLCNCKICRQYTRSYLHHMFRNNEILYSMLASYHNLAFLHDFVKRIRFSIENGTFLQFKKDFLEHYNENSNN